MVYRNERCDWKGAVLEERHRDAGGGRVVSIDALRGFDMFWIIGGGTLIGSLAKVWPHRVAETIEHQLHHVKWGGFHFEDLIYPLFIFLLGAVMPFSISRRLERGESRTRLYLHIVKRTAGLILLGLIMNGLLRIDWPNMRWPGVLQRIGLCYFFAALVVVHTKWRTQAAVIVTTLLLYWAVTMLVPVPGFGAGEVAVGEHPPNPAAFVDVDGSAVPLVIGERVGPRVPSA